MLLAGIYSVQMDSRLKTSGMTTITVIIYWDWYNSIQNGCWASCVSSASSPYEACVIRGIRCTVYPVFRASIRATVPKA